jgi:hypothetical protein
MKMMKKKLAVGITAVLLAFPFSTLALGSNPINSVMVATKTTASVTTEQDVITAAEAAVAAYEAAPLTTLAEVSAAEGLKAAADTAVAAVEDADQKAAFELRVTNREAVIAAAKIALTPVVDENGTPIIASNWFTDFIGKLQLALTFDPARKAELCERHALAKLAKAHKLINEGKPEAAMICVNEYNNRIAKAQAFLTKIQDPTSETAQNLEKALVNVDKNNVEVLTNIIDKLPPKDAQKLALKVVHSMEKAVHRIEKEEAKADRQKTLEDKILKEQAKAALKEFKKSLNQKGKVHIEDQDNKDNDQDNQNDKRSKADQNQYIRPKKSTHVTVAPIKDKSTPKVTQEYKQGKDNRDKQSDKWNNKCRDKDDNRWDYKKI